MQDYPSDQQIERLHRKYARSDEDFELVYEHCLIVKSIAMQLLESRQLEDIDRELVHVGCMLHDIGAYEVMEDGRFVAGVRHGVLGASVLGREGYPESLRRICACHTGVGLTPDDVVAQGLPIPVADYTAKSAEERLVMYADKFHSKSNPPLEAPYFCTYEWFRQSIAKFGEDKVGKLDALAEEFGKPDLNSLSERHGYSIKSLS